MQSTTTWPRTAPGSIRAWPSERNRTARSRSANRYLKRIRYGNQRPWRPAWTVRSGQEPRRLALRGGLRLRRPPAGRPAARRLTGPGPPRSDPFSTYRPGFEVRTYRRCHRVLMFHHFPDEPGVGADCLVASTDLAYASTGGSGMTTVASVTHTGYRRRDGGYHAASLPPLELRYSRAVIGTEVRDLDPGSAGEPARRGGRHRLPVGGPGRGGAVRHPGPAGRRLVLPGQPRRGPVRAAADAGHPARRRGRVVPAHASNCSTWPATGTWTLPSSAARCLAATSGPATTAGSRSARSAPARTSPGTTRTCAWSTWTGTAWPTC